MGDKTQNRGRQNGDDETTDDDAEQAAMSKDEIRRLVVATVNGTVEKTVKKTFEGLNLGAQIQDALSGALGPLTERLDKFEAGAGKQQQGQQQAAISPELQKQLDLLKKRADDAEAARKKAEDEQKAGYEKSRRREERDALGAALRKAGIPDALASAAVSMLSEKGIIKRGDDDSIGWVHEDESLPLDKGVATWMKSDEGKQFLPARPVAGSGAGRNGTIQQGQKLTKDQEIGLALSGLAGIPDFGG